MDSVTLFFKARCLLVKSAMAVVIFSWVSISVVFCLALVRAAARRPVISGCSLAVGATTSDADTFLRGPASFQQEQRAQVIAVQLK
jgi:hypothetical protein